MIRKQSSDENQSLIESSTDHLKQTMTKIIEDINSEAEQARKVVSYVELERIDLLTKMIKDFVELVKP